MSEKKEVIEEVRKRSVRKTQIKEGLAAVLLLVMIVSLGVFLWPASDQPEKVEYASAGEDTVHSSSTEAAATYNITDIGVSPASHRVELGKSVAFRNKLDDEVSISFDRSNNSIDLNPRQTETLLINGITYFDVNGQDYSASGRVNVQ